MYSLYFELSIIVELYVPIPQQFVVPFFTQESLFYWPHVYITVLVTFMYRKNWNAWNSRIGSLGMISVIPENPWGASECQRQLPCVMSSWCSKVRTKLLVSSSLIFFSPCLLSSPPPLACLSCLVFPGLLWYPTISPACTLVTKFSMNGYNTCEKLFSTQLHIVETWILDFLNGVVNWLVEAQEI